MMKEGSKSEWWGEREGREVVEGERLVSERRGRGRLVGGGEEVRRKGKNRVRGRVVLVPVSVKGIYF